MTDSSERTPFTGVLQIFAYNRPFYLATLTGVAMAITLALFMPLVLRLVLFGGAALALFWTCASLAVSHLIYDRSGLYELGWLGKVLSRLPERWIAIHAGVDEMSPALADALPDGGGTVIDI